MTGHSVHTGGGAFDDLEAVHRGEPIVVRTGQATLRYVIRRVRIYGKGLLDELATNVFSQRARGRLVLVTCEGWNGERYLSNVVVTATPHPARPNHPGERRRLQGRSESGSRTSGTAPIVAE